MPIDHRIIAADELVERVIDTAKARRHSRADVARLTGLSKPTVYHYFSGKAKPTLLSTRLKLAQYVDNGKEAQVQHPVTPMEVTPKRQFLLELNRLVAAMGDLILQEILNSE